jgi:histidinol-phosphate aminotransferase
MYKRLLRDSLRNLKPMVIGKPIEEVQQEYNLKEIVKLGSNENPWGTSTKVLEAMKSEMSKINQYPVNMSPALRKVLANRLDVDEDMLIVSNGGAAVFSLVTQAFVDKTEEVIMAKPTFPIYRRATLLNGGIPIEVPLLDFTHDLDRMLDSIGEKTKVIVICNPNNPTGTIVTHSALERFLNAIPQSILVVLDDVYADFCTSPDIPDSIAFIRAGKPVISIRTFSKLYGLAGIRIGYAVASKDCIECLEIVQEPFAVNRLAQAAALAALDSNEFRNFVIRETIKLRGELYEELCGIGLKCIPSHANFIFADLKKNAQDIFKSLLPLGFIIRAMEIWEMPTWVRITVGTREQNHQLAKVLGELLS